MDQELINRKLTLAAAVSRLQNYVIANISTAGMYQSTVKEFRKDLASPGDSWSVATMQDRIYHAKKWAFEAGSDDAKQAASFLAEDAYKRAMKLLNHIAAEHACFGNLASREKQD